MLPGSIAAARCSNVFLGQQLRELGLECLEPSSKLADVGELCRLDDTIVVLGEDQDVDHADRSGVDQCEQLFHHLTGEVAGARRGNSTTA